MPELPPPTHEITDPERLNRFGANPFLDGPGEFLCKVIAEELAGVPQWKAIFGDFIDPYMRMDYSLRNLPALRIYSNSWVKESESWFINGDVLMDVIWPASIRRTETQTLPDTIATALCQQFRSPSLFTTLTQRIPGLNELGKVFSVQKGLGFQWQDDTIPLTQITINFRLDLRIWDDYLTEQCRTRETPFERTLGELRSIIATIQAMRDDDTEEEGLTVGLELDQTD